MELHQLSGRYATNRYLWGMEVSQLHIKNMVCDRCIRAVAGLLEKYGLQAKTIQLGEVTLDGPVSSQQLEPLSKDLEAMGFALIDDRRSRLVSAVKTLLIELIHYGDLEGMRQNFSDYIAEKLHRDYHAISSLFSEMEAMTIEQFIILQKIEKVKELLAYDELSLGEIAFRMGYSSAAHLSAQFKKVTGFTPSRFKKLKDHRRRPLDGI